MVSYSGSWDSDRVEEFLNEHTGPIRIGCQRPGGDPWIVCLWYRFHDAVFRCATSADADVTEYIRRNPVCSFDVSTNTIPYRGVRGNGRARIVPQQGNAWLEDLVDRYLQSRESSLARMLLRTDREEVGIRIDPEIIFSWDFSARMKDATPREKT